MRTQDRISYLDGHRGIAILLVVLFHAYSRWPGIVPYGDLYADFPIFKAGWLGVELFFLISGFVILMTLERCQSIREFIYRRWLRLFPAMLICSLMVFFSSPFFYERPAGKPTLLSLLPGLTFISPEWFEVFRIRISPLEGAFWSLYVEFKFYFFAGFLYFWKGTNWLLVALSMAFIASILVPIGNHSIQNVFYRYLADMISLSDFQYFGWFAAGAAFYCYNKNKELKFLAIAGILAFLSSIFIKNLSIKPALAACLISALFAVSVINPRIQKIVGNRFFLFYGFISYPLYLFHENMMVSMIVKFGHIDSRLPLFFYPLLSIIILSCIALPIALYGEPCLKKYCIFFLGDCKRSDTCGGWKEVETAGGRKL